MVVVPTPAPTREPTLALPPRIPFAHNLSSVRTHHKHTPSPDAATLSALASPHAATALPSPRAQPACHHPVLLFAPMHAAQPAPALVAQASTPVPAKRDRPLSSYFDLPADELDQMFRRDGAYDAGAESALPAPARLTTSQPALSALPLMRRRPFHNLSNIVHSFEFPSVRRKLTQLTKSLTRLVTQAGPRLFARPESGPGDKSGHFVAQSGISSPNGHLVAQSGLDSDDANTTVEDANTTIEDAESPTQPVKAIRRIHSLCQTNREKQLYNLTDDNSHLPKTSIRTFKVDNDLLPRIDADQMLRIIAGAHARDFDHILVVDCRFAYEYAGGHIAGAVNMLLQRDLETLLLQPLKGRTLVVFHCEFSIFRGPTMALHLRKCDRIANRDRYPYLTFPDVVVLEGGYKGFYDAHMGLCNPRGYVEMKDENHRKACELEMDRVRQDAKLTRAKSYNQFSKHPNTSAHARLASYTTVTSHAENLKILKRQRLSLKVQNSLQRSASSIEPPSRHLAFSSLSIFNSHEGLGQAFFDDVQPPPALFKSASSLGHRKSQSSTAYSTLTSSFSIDSLSLLLCLENSPFSSTDSLTETYASPTEYPDPFESKNSGNSSSSKSVLNPVLRRPSGPVPHAPGAFRPPSGVVCGEFTASVPTVLVQNTGSLPNSGFKFPNNASGLKPARHSLNRINTKNTFQVVHSSPVISLPLLTATPISTIDSTVSNHTLSIIDPINDTPVDFSVPFGLASSIFNPVITPTNNHSFFKGPGPKMAQHVRKRLGSLLLSGGGSFNFMALDIDEVDEVDEEDTEDDEVTVT